MTRPLLQGRSIGMVLLSIYLILAGLVALFSLTFAGLSMLMGVLALLAGIAILAGR
jgi:uncharacterized membrane protein HdeD (DUF308 family)